MDANRKDFAFGKNYDSDYLCGKRFQRVTTARPTNVHKRHSHRQRKHRQQTDAIDNRHKHGFKTFDKRLTLRPKISGLANNYGRKEGMFANGVSDARVDTDAIRESKQRFAARIREDLAWILNKPAKTSPQPPPHRQSHHKHNHLSVRRKLFVTEKHPQKSCPKELVETSGSDSESSESPKRKQSSHLRYNPLNDTKIAKNDTKTGRMLASVTDNKRLNAVFEVKTCDKSQSTTRRDFPLNKSMVSLPSSLTIVQNLLQSYENERKVLGQRSETFANDLMMKICHQLIEMSNATKQSFKEVPIPTRILSSNSSIIESSVVYSTPKSLIQTNHKNLDKSCQNSVHSLPKISNINSSCQELVPIGSNVGTMMSRILLNISEAFQLLSSKCNDQTFFNTTN